MKGWLGACGLALAAAVLAPRVWGESPHHHPPPPQGDSTGSAPVAVVAGSFGAGARTDPTSGANGCLGCHEGLEPMHPQAELSCVDCHGGDGEARQKFKAHVQPQVKDPGDERVDPVDQDLAFRRFQNPMDLRVVEQTCGECHADLTRDLFHSLHGTTAGHLSDGFYEMGLFEERGSRYSVFPVVRRSDQGGEIERLVQPPAFRVYKDGQTLATHFPDLTRKECMQCHLWSEGRAVRGRIGFDGDYRGDGCAACHVPYALNGLSDSADRSIDKGEPGHPLRHVMTRAPSTQTCTSCHWGDASIGLHFRGLSQLPPGAAGGPEVEGTTDSPLNRLFYLNDPELVPPDVHHEKGMHCIDCHTLGDVMGDGKLHGAMEHAVEISCQACHGSFTAPATLKTERGTPLQHMYRDGGQVFLKSKVTGEVHEVTQVVNLLNESHDEFSPDASLAMTKAHAGVECYACHSGWNVNFLGFHFYRNEALTQLDLLSGQRTPGRVTTQDKVFATWKSFYAGFNEAGRVAPYLTGFSTMGSVDDADGDRVLDQVMPVTAAGLSGMTMIHHQMHTVRPTARACVECHRTSTTWGMGSSNFRLARQLAFVADRRGIEVVALERAQLASSTPLAKLVLPDVVDLEIDAEPLQGHARYLYAAEGGRGIHVIDVSDPAHPRRAAFVESVSPRGMALAGDYLYSADGIGGLRVYDVSEPEKIHRIGSVPMLDAYEVAIRWPYAYVADGPGGLVIVDVRAPISPRVVGGVDTSFVRGAASRALDVDVIFQYSRPEVDFEGGPAAYRTTARNVCAVLDEDAGLVLVDVTEPTHARVLYPRPAEAGRSTARPGRERAFSYRSLSVRSHVDLASPAGGDRTTERDYAYFLEERLLGDGRARSFMRVIDITDPRRPQQRGREAAGYATEMLTPAAFYNTPFLQPVGFSVGERGVLAMDLSVSAKPVELGILNGIVRSYAMAVEEFPLDKMLDEDGKRLKDVSHEGSRWMYRAEIEHVLDVPGLALGTIEPGEAPPAVRGATARTFFGRHDKDRNGLLTGEEYERAGGRSADLNEDGRITLAEVFDMGRAVSDHTEVAEVPDDPFLTTRVDPDGDLARLFDGTNPYDFDRTDDSRLDRKEVSRAMFAALDLDGNQRLTLAELSRHPGALRQLRYGDLSALEQFGSRDLNRGGTVSPREFRIADREWEALDADEDGFVQLSVPVEEYWRRRGVVGPLTEWPTRQPIVAALPPVITTDKVFEALDSNDDRKFTKRELKKRPELFRQLDRNGDDLVTEEEVAYWAAFVTENGVEVSPDSFEARWDIDGSGEVDEDELPPAAWIPLRR